MTTQTSTLPPEFDVEARSICDARAAWWEQLRAFNASPVKTGTMAAGINRRDDEINARVEQLHRRYFPRAHRLIVADGEAITLSRTGRSTRRVWKAEEYTGSTA